MTAIIGLRQPWQWVQPVDDAALVARLIEARDYAVHERERENLCSVAAIRIDALCAENAELRTVALKLACDALTKAKP